MTAVLGKRDVALGTVRLTGVPSAKLRVTVRFRDEIEGYVVRDERIDGAAVHEKRHDGLLPVGPAMIPLT